MTFSEKKTIILTWIKFIEEKKNRRKRQSLYFSRYEMNNEYIKVFIVGSKQRHCELSTSNEWMNQVNDSEKRKQHSPSTSRKHQQSSKANAIYWALRLPLRSARAIWQCDIRCTFIKSYQSFPQYIWRKKADVLIAIQLFCCLFLT